MKLSEQEQYDEWKALPLSEKMRSEIAMASCYADEVAQLEADLEERTKQFHLAEVKVISREAIIEQLSETELAKDVTRLEAELEDEQLRSDVYDKNFQKAYKRNKQLEAENEALRKLAHDYITAYEKLAFGDALLTGVEDE